MTYKSILKRTGRIALYVLMGVAMLICLLLVFINLPTGKRVVRNQVQSYLRDKLKTKIVIGSVDYSLPKWLEINNVYIEDQKKDTLLFGEQLSVDIDMIKLIRGNTQIEKILFKNIFLNISRPENDSSFNFQFIIDAFTGNKPEAQSNPDTAELKLSMDRLLFDNVALRFKDQYSGTDFWARIRNLDASLRKFQPDRINFNIEKFYASGVDFFMTTYKETIPDTISVVASDNKTAPSYGLNIEASAFQLRDVDVTVENKVNGMYYANKVKHLALGNVLFNMDRSIAIADTLLLDSSFVQFVNPKSTIKKIAKADSTTSAPWQIRASQVSLSNDQFKYDDLNAIPAGGFDFSHFNLKNVSTDISSFVFSGDTTAALIRQLKFNDTSEFVLDNSHVDFLMTGKTIAAKNLYIKTAQSLLQKDIEIRFDSLGSIQKDPANTLITAVLNNSTIAFNDLYLLVPSLKTSLPPATFQNNYVRFNTELRGTMQRIYLPYLQLTALSGSTVNAHGTLYNISDANKFNYDLYIDGSSFRKSDILKFMPPEQREAMSKLPDIINLRGRISGNKNDLSSNLQITGKDLLISGIFSLKNISDPTRLQYGVDIKNSSFNKNFVMGFIPPGTLPEGVNLPQKLTAAGSFKGDANNFDADLKLGGSYGPMSVKGYMKNIKDPARSTYDLDIGMDNFSIGKLLGQDSVLGNFSGTVKAKGTGFDYKTMRSDITATVRQLQYNNHNYENALIAANFNAGVISSQGSINDSSLRMNYDIDLDVRKEYPAINGFVNVDTAQLQKLNLYNDTLNFSLYANISANNLQPRSLDINTVIDSIKLQLGQNFYSLDTVSLLATSANGVDDINFNSAFADIHANGAFDYDQIAAAVTRYVDHYYDIAPDNKSVQIKEQDMTFDGVFKYHPLITAVLPDLKSYDNINFNGGFNSANTDSALKLNMNIPYLVYQTNSVRNGTIDINSRNERLNYAVNFDTLKYAKNTFYGTTLNGSAANDSLVINALTQDNKSRDWFGLNASVFVKDSTYSFRLKDNLLLNYQQWNVAADNYIRYSPDGLIIHNFSISSDTSRIYINSQQEIVNSPIDATVDNFNLKSISAIISSDTLFASGILDAKLVASELDKTVPAFTGNLTITDLELMQQPLGTVTAFAERQAGNIVTAKVNLHGNRNDIEATGNYYLDNVQKEFDAALDIRQLNLASLQGFSFGSIRNATGNIRGNLKAEGNFADPSWKGELNFDTTRFTVTQLGTPYKINDQKIIFDRPSIQFNDFSIRDSLDHVMNINGSISMKKDMSMELALGISASEFILLNAPRAISNELYGFASADVNIGITGTSEAPKIDGDIFVNEKSDVTIVIPERSYSKDEGRTIVRFIDRDTFDINPPPVPFVPEKEVQSSFAQFLQYNLNIEINKYSALRIIIDPVTGDEIQVQGDAQLNAGVDPGGNIILSGNYELDKGYYVFNYQFLQRRFELQRGSTIVFAGEPMQARIDIKAAYAVNTSAKDLLDNEVSNADLVLANSFNQKVPINVILNITGVISKPTIKFDIVLDDENVTINNDLKSTIENKLTQIRGDEASTNKQVFSLLLLGRFVGEQSSDFFKGNGNEFNDLARQSVSQFLSSALNEIAGNLFKGIDIDLNLNSYRDYEGTGSSQKTDLNVVLSKTFLDDRLTVSVGKNFGVEGQDAAAKAANNNFIPDVTLAYKLSKDGKYLIRAYRRNQFEVILDGYVVETGLGFLVTMDYNTFNELFKRKKRK